MIWCIVVCVGNGYDDEVWVIDMDRMCWQDFGKNPTYLERMKQEAEEEKRRWEEEQQEEIRKRESMKLSEEEREEILQVNSVVG